MSTKTKNVLTVWSPYHCPADTGGDHSNLHAAAAIAITIACSRKTTATVIMDKVTIADDGKESRSPEGIKILEVDGKNILQNGMVRGFYVRPDGPVPKTFDEIPDENRRGIL